MSVGHFIHEAQLHSCMPDSIDGIVNCQLDDTVTDSYMNGLVRDINVF